MANINVGEVDLEGGRYEVILRRLGAGVAGPPPVAGPPAVVPEEVNPAVPEEVNPAGGGKKSKKGKKAKKAKGTRKLSPYMKFAQEARKNILAEDPSLKSDIIAVGKRIGEKWRALSDAEKARY